MSGVEEFNLRLPDGRTFGPAPLETMIQWAREGRVPATAELAPADGSPARPVLAEPRLRAVLESPPTAPGQVQEADADDSPVSAVIPYRNPAALVGYYISIFSLLPGLGLLAGPAAVVLGVIGLRRRRANPRIHGAAHAWIAIILGTIGSLISYGLAAIFLLAFLADA